jgi:hypothetical protein
LWNVAAVMYQSVRGNVQRGNVATGQRGTAFKPSLQPNCSQLSTWSDANQARRLAAQFKHCTFTHVYRDNNKRADALSNEAMDIVSARPAEFDGSRWVAQLPRVGAVDVAACAGDDIADGQGDGRPRGGGGDTVG